MVADSGTLPAHRSTLPVAVDAAGNDHGIEPQVEGAILAFKEFGVRSALVGPSEELKSRLEALGGERLPISVVNAPEVITMDETPTRAVVRKPNSSLRVAYSFLESGRASSMISAGNSGAMMAAGIMTCGLLPGIKRPAIATLIPSAGDRHPNVVLDSGANVDCRAHNLVQFAVMGDIYCRSLFGVRSPRIALLSNGSEPSKGTDLIRAAALELSRLENIRFVGYVEGRDVAGDASDVIVCDGFVGNVFLKAMEGCVRLIFNELVHEGQKGFFRRLGKGLSRGVYNDVFSDKFDYSTYGGAPLLGLSKLAIVLHGASDSRAVKNAIRVADEFARSKMTEKIGAKLALLEEEEIEPMDEIFTQVLSPKTDGRVVPNEKVVQPKDQAQDQTKDISLTEVVEDEELQVESK